jgi:hypothetical protein
MAIRHSAKFRVTGTKTRNSVVLAETKMIITQTHGQNSAMFSVLLSPFKDISPRKIARYRVL